MRVNKDEVKHGGHAPVGTHGEVLREELLCQVSVGARARGRQGEPDEVQMHAVLQAGSRSAGVPRRGLKLVAWI